VNFIGYALLAIDIQQSMTWISTKISWILLSSILSIVLFYSGLVSPFLELVHFVDGGAWEGLFNSLCLVC
jgi:hypothetical protein